MKTFKQYLKEATLPNWNNAVRSNPELKVAVELLSAIESLGGEALIVGGAVRDLIMGKPPHDVDIATNVPMEKLEKNFKTYPVGAKFGVLLIDYKGHKFEVAQYRKDIYHPDFGHIVR